MSSTLVIWFNNYLSVRLQEQDSVGTNVHGVNNDLHRPALHAKSMEHPRNFHNLNLNICIKHHGTEQWAEVAPLSFTNEWKRNEIQFSTTIHSLLCYLSTFLFNQNTRLKPRLLLSLKYVHINTRHTKHRHVRSHLAAIYIFSRLTDARQKQHY